MHRLRRQILFLAILLPPLISIGGDAREKETSQVRSLSIKVVGDSYFGGLYAKQATLTLSESGYKLKYSCFSRSRTHEACPCSSIDKEMGDTEVRELLEFVSTLRDEGEGASCCDHPWTEVTLERSARRRQTIRLSYDLLKEQISMLLLAEFRQDREAEDATLFSFCGLPVVRSRLDDSASQFRLGRELHRIGFFKSAVGALERAIQLNSEKVELNAYELLGDAYRQLWNYEKALEAYNRLLARAPADARTLLTVGELYTKLRRPGEAIARLEQALRLDPPAEVKRMAYAQLGDIYSGLQKHREEVEAYKQVLRLDPDNKWTHYVLGQRYVELGNSKAALKQYEALKNLKSNYADDLHIFIYQEAIRRNPKDPKSHFNLGNAYYWARRHGDAIEPYKEAIRLKPDLELAYSRLGRSYLELNRYEEAIEAIKGAIRLNPNDYMDHGNLGLAYSYAGKHELGLEHLKEAIRLKPDSPVAHNNLGYVLRAMGRNKEAIESLDRAIRLNPEDDLPHYNRGLAYFNLAQYKEAVESLDQAIRLNPKNPDSHLNLGNAYRELKRWHEAVKAYREAIDLRPNSVDARFQLGLVYLDMGDREAAIEMHKELEIWDKARAKELLRLIRN